MKRKYTIQEQAELRVLREEMKDIRDERRELLRAWRKLKIRECEIKE